MTLYHVTSADAVQSIWNHGLTSSPPESDWVAERQAMHQLIDEFGYHQHEDWVSREGAVYFWPTRQAAYLYSGRHLHPAIVEVDSSSRTFWMVPNDPIEQLFNAVSRSGATDPNTLKEDDAVVEKARSVVRQARVWNGQRDGDLEVWTQPPITPDAVVRITDHEGEPFDIQTD